MGSQVLRAGSLASIPEQAGRQKLLCFVLFWQRTGDDSESKRYKRVNSPGPGMTRQAKGTKESIGPGLGMILFELKSKHMFPCALAQGRNSGHHDRE